METKGVARLSGRTESSLHNDSAWKDKYLKYVLLATCILFLVVAIVSWSSTPLVLKFFYLILAAILAFSALSHTSYEVRGAILLIVLLLSGASLLLLRGNEAEAALVFFSTAVLAALIYERPVGYLVVFLSSAIILISAYLSISTRATRIDWLQLDYGFTNSLPASWMEWFTYLVYFIVLSVIPLVAIQLLKKDFWKVLSEADTYQKELVNSRITLETRVDERTLELKKANEELEKGSHQLERRAERLTLITDVSRSIASIQNIDEVLSTVTAEISSRFHFYHSGIFLLDETKTYAVLESSSSAGGKRMLARGHKLKVGEEGIVGFVTGSGQPRIAVNTGADVVFFKNPDLPQTRSELALPLKIGDQIIGALDVQSDLENAFSEDDIKMLEMLAFQVAIAIHNANLFSETKKALADAQAAYQKFVEMGWRQFMEQTTMAGYQYVNNTVQPLAKPLDRPEINAVLESGQTMTDESENVKVVVPTLAVPIKVRGETIGVIDIRSISRDRIWENSDKAIAETIAERLAFALENSRLIVESQKRVARERAISDMSAKIGSAVEIDSIMQQTVQELGKLIGNSEVVIQIGNEPNR